jgi:large subunit ribosomal protein L24
MKKFSKTWKSSKKAKKQRKFRFNSPLHIRGKFLSSHLSKELRAKYKKRNVRLRVGDKVKIAVGQFKGKNGKVERVLTKRCKVYITGIEMIKKDGTKMMYALEPSNLIIVELNTEDKKRIKALERK